MSAVLEAQRAVLDGEDGARAALHGSVVDLAAMAELVAGDLAEDLKE